MGRALMKAKLGDGAKHLRSVVKSEEVIDRLQVTNPLDTEEHVLAFLPPTVTLSILQVQGLF